MNFKQRPQYHQKAKLLEQQIIDLYQTKTPIKQIITICKVPYQYIYAILNKKQIIKRQSRHTDDPYFLDVVAKMKRDGLSQREIAKRLNVSDATITNALRKRGY